MAFVIVPVWETFNLQVIIFVTFFSAAWYVSEDHRYELKWIRSKCERVANSGAFKSVQQVYALGHMRLPELIKIQFFKKCELVVHARLGLWNDDYGMLTKLHWLEWVHQAWHYAKHIEKVLSLTHYKTLMTLIGYCIIADLLWLNILWCINTTGLASTLNECQKGCASPFIPPQCWGYKIFNISKHLETDLCNEWYIWVN